MLVELTGRLLGFVGMIVTVISMVTSPIWLLFTGRWQLVLLELGLLLILNVVILPLLFNVSLSAVRGQLESAIMHHQDGRVFWLTLANSLWQSLVLFLLTFLIFVFVPRFADISTPYLMAVVTVTCAPLFLMAMSDKSEAGRDLSSIDAGIFATGVVIALLPMLFNHTATLSIVWVIVFLILRIFITVGIARSNARKIPFDSLIKGD